jgi:heme exporter protein C
MPRRVCTHDILFAGLLVVAVLVTIGAIEFVFLKAPTEAQMGIIQKVFYFHVPSAYAMYLGAAGCFVGSVAYLRNSTDRRDAIARAGAETAVVFGIIVMVTGPLWAIKAWGQYWTWDPRLTTSMLSVLIYVAYVVLRAFGGDGESERKFAAALGFLGGVNLPIIHFSVQKWSGQHPKVIGKGGGGLHHPDMKIAFAMGMIAFTFLAAILFWSRLRIALTHARLRHAEQQAMELGIGAPD